MLRTTQHNPLGSEPRDKLSLSSIGKPSCLFLAKSSAPEYARPIFIQPHDSQRVIPKRRLFPQVLYLRIEDLHDVSVYVLGQFVIVTTIFCISPGNNGPHTTDKWTLRWITQSGTP